MLLINLMVYAPNVKATYLTWKAGDNVTVTLSESTLYVSGTGDMYSYDIKSCPWRSYCLTGSNIVNLVIGSGITSIGDYAFEDCMSLIGNLTIPTGVSKIGNGAFWGCNGFTGNLVIPTGVISIGNRAFENCYGFTGNLTIPTGVTVIDYNTSGGCSGFTGDLIIPIGVEIIGQGAFGGCSGLNGTFEIPSSVTYLDKNIVQITNFKKVINNSIITISLSNGAGLYWIDSLGNIITSITNGTAYKVLSNSELNVSTVVSKTSCSVGDKLTITATGTGGTGSFTYKFIVYNKDTNQWATLQDYSSTASLTCTAGSVGNREFYVDIKDSAGTVVRSTAMNVVTTTQDTVYDIKLGDVTNDGTIDIFDILLLQRYILGTETLTESLITAADVTNDKKVDIFDILAIQRHIMGIEIIV